MRKNGVYTYHKTCTKFQNFYDLIPNLVAVDSANRDVVVAVDRDRTAGFGKSSFTTLLKWTKRCPI